MMLSRTVAFSMRVPPQMMALSTFAFMIFTPGSMRAWV